MFFYFNDGSEARRYIKEADEILKRNPLKKQTFLGQMLDKREKYNLELNDIVAAMCDLIIGGVDTVKYC